MYDLLEEIAYGYAFDGEIEKAAVLTSYSDLYNLIVNLRGAKSLVALDAIKELQRAGTTGRKYAAAGHKSRVIY